MAKLGAVAILAIATFINSVSADAGCIKNDGGEGGQCSGTEDSQKKICCEGFKCIRKDELYAQCLSDDTEVPADWDGNEVELDSESMGQPPMSADAPMMDDDGMDEDGMGEDAMEEDAMEGDAMEGDAMEDDAMEDDDMEDDASAPASAPANPIVPGEDRYIAVIAKDYIPSQANNMSTPNAVKIEDISGHAVKGRKGCEDLCSTTPMCNLASFYLDSSSFFGAEDKNCWLKTLADSCELPSDALDDPNAVLLLKVDKCPDAEELIDATDVMDAEGPDAVGPDAVGPDAVAPEGETTAIAPRGGVDLGDDIASPDVEGTPAGAVSVRGAVAALGIASIGVALLF